MVIFKGSKVKAGAFIARKRESTGLIFFPLDLLENGNPDILLETQPARNMIVH